MFIGSGAYCSGMSAKNYNSFPEAPEVLVDMEGQVHVIRERQALAQVYQNEVGLPAGVIDAAAAAKETATA
jgi:diaminopimelate decarboxylase